MRPTYTLLETWLKERDLQSSPGSGSSVDLPATFTEASVQSGNSWRLKYINALVQGHSSEADLGMRMHAHVPSTGRHLARALYVNYLSHLL